MTSIPQLIPFGGVICSAWLLAVAAVAGHAVERRAPNILLFTADDLNCDSLGCYGSKVPDITPNLDRFAATGIRFERAHVNVAICQPSRGVLGTGRYSHRSGITGFYHTKRDIPTVMETLQTAGYLTGILGKVAHSTPKESFRWDFSRDQGELGQGRDPARYYDYCREFLARCRREGKPFYFMVNSHDPHRPYHDPEKPPYPGEAAQPSRLYPTQEVTVPGFLPDLPGVRKEIAHYFNSVRRCDDTFGAVMQALQEAGFEDNTLVVFLSDNGIAVPFAKCNCYLASTRTPWMMRWPGVVKPGSVDNRHFVSGIDFFPTVLESAGFPCPTGLDGVSLLPILRGGTQAGRDRVFTQIDHQSGGAFVPMRGLQDKKYGYIFTPWSDGKFRYRNNNEGQSMRAMEEAAKADAWIASRVALFRYRTLEEFYDLEQDPNALHNLIADVRYAGVIAGMRSEMIAWMRRTEDPALAALENRTSPEALKQFMTDPEKPKASEKRKKQGGGRKRKAN
jgi:N-sulfoglucosamine sulfohydrolase